MLELDQLDHLRGSSRPLIVEYGDYECPYSRAAYREIEHVEQVAPLRFVFRHFPLTEIHPHALAASAAAEAAALQGRFWRCTIGSSTGRRRLLTRTSWRTQ